MARRSSRSERGSGDAKSGKVNRLFHRGEEGVSRVDDELEQQKIRRDQAKKEAGKPMRFYVPIGETKEIVVLDDKPDFFMYEHTLKDPRTGRWGLQLPCIKEWDNCPVCEQVSESTYIMFLSIIVLTPHVDKKGKTHPFTRMLMAVKPTQQKKFIRRYHKEDTLRGAIFECSRDGGKDAAIGNDIEFMEFMSEEELMEDYINEWKDRDGKTHVDNCGEVIDYEALFEEPTQESLRAIVGGESPPGSKDQVDRDLDRKSDDGWDEEGDDDSTPWKEDEEEGEEEEKESTSRSSRKGRSSSRSSGRSSRSSRKDVPEEDGPKEREGRSRGDKRRPRNEPAKQERSSRRSRASSRR